MTKKNTNKLLIFGVVLLWGYIIFEVITAIIKSSPDSINGTDTLAFRNNLSSEKYISSGEALIDVSLVRDPFNFTPAKPIVSSTPMPKPINMDRLPAGIMYRIAGVIINENRRVVLLEDKTDNRSVFLRENDKYENLKIIGIQHQVVVLEESGIKKIYELEKK